MENGYPSHTNDAVEMIGKLPVVQRFLHFLTHNMQALLLLLLSASVSGNVFLIREIIHVNRSNEAFKSATIDYERLRGEKLEEILREEVKREILHRQNR